jgi:hypothetical protein
MAKKIALFTKIDPELRARMRRYKAVVGVPEAVQVDRAMREWLDRYESVTDAVPRAKAKRR